MIRYILAFLILGGTAMAKDGNVQAPRASGMPQNRADDFWQSPEGQWIDQQFQRYQNGEITLDQAMKAYDEKFGAPDLSGVGKQNPQLISPPR